MAATYYGKNGKMIFFDSTRGRDLSQSGPKQVHVSNEVGGSHTNITANMLNVSSGTNTVMAVNTDRVYIGQDFQFSRIAVALSTPASADGGALVVEYWNGSAWVAVSGMTDTTKIGVNTFRQNGDVTWIIPSNWVKNDVPATGTTLYYVRIRTTTSTATDAVAELIEPASGQYYELVFSQMNLTAPEGHNRPEEIIRTNRMQHDVNTHHIQGPDDVILAQENLTFSCWLDSVHNKAILPTVLQCGNAGVAATWPRNGISCKTDTSLIQGLTSNAFPTPQFSDPNKKAICVQAMWDDLTGSKIFREYNEVYVTPINIVLNESPEAVVLNVTGYIYGTIRSDLTNFGYRY